MADEGSTSASVPVPPPPTIDTSSGVHPNPTTYPASIAFVNNLQSPTTLFDGTNYVTWSASFRRFLEIHGRLSFLTDDPASTRGSPLHAWVVQDRAVTSWLLKMAIPSIAEPMQLISPSKTIWDEWTRMYGYRSNISRTVDIFEGLFKTKQAGRSLQDFYGSLRALLNQLEIYQPFATDIATQRRYREELAVALFLAGLDSPLSSQIRGPILSETSLPTLGETFSTALRVSTRTASPAPTLSPSESTAPLILRASSSRAWIGRWSKAVAEMAKVGVVDETARHILHASIASAMVIGPTVAGRSSANLIRWLTLPRPTPHPLLRC